MLKHVDADCTGRWALHHEIGSLFCTVCGAECEPAGPEVGAALRENRLGTLVFQLACEGWLLLYGTPRRDAPDSQPRR